MRFIVPLAAAAAMAAAPASALTINLINVGGVTAGSDSAKAFQTAANFWSGLLTNSVTVNIDVGYSALGTNILGQTSSTTYTASAGSVVAAIRAGGNSQLDALAKTSLAQYTGGSIGMITPGYVNVAARTGANIKTPIYDNDGSTNNTVLGVTGANAKALGLGVASGAIDATIKFSSTYAFDFNPTDGIAANKIDFVGVAIHEIGHALGFVSGVDDYDYIAAPKGGGAASFGSYAVNNDWWGYALDLFRYSANTKKLGGAGAKLDWNPGDGSYFSVDGGATAYKGGYFSTGIYNGDKWQASHWKRTSGKAAIGVMDPAVAYGQQDVVTALDLASLDAIGWNVNFDVLAKSTWRQSTAQIGLASGLFPSGAAMSGGGVGLNTGVVPEPTSWVLLIAGFGLTGTMLRQRRTIRA